MKKKLLYLITEDWFFCSHFIARAVTARNNGFEVIVATRVREHGHLILAAGLRLVNLDFERRSLQPLREICLIFKIYKLYLSERPDLVHHIALKPILYGTLCALLIGLRRVINAPVGMGYIFTSTKGLARFLRPSVDALMRRLLNPKGSRVILENKDDLEYLCTHGFIRQKDAVLIRGAGVDLKHFRPQPEPPGVPVVALMARMLWDKGVGDFVKAAYLIKSSGIKARFLLVGEPDKENPSVISSSQLLAWQQEGLIEWLGHCDNVSEILSKSHIVCLPSYREGLPKSLLEALASGKPVVTTNVPGCREAVTHDDNGLLVEPRDPKALAFAIRRLIEAPHLRSLYGLRGRARAESEFGVDKINHDTCCLYTEIMDI